MQQYWGECGFIPDWSINYGPCMLSWAGAGASLASDPPGPLKLAGSMGCGGDRGPPGSRPVTGAGRDEGANLQGSHRARLSSGGNELQGRNSVCGSSVVRLTFLSWRSPDAAPGTHGAVPPVQYMERLWHKGTSPGSEMNRVFNKNSEGLF